MFSNRVFTVSYADQCAQMYDVVPATIPTTHGTNLARKMIEQP